MLKFMFVLNPNKITSKKFKFTINFFVLFLGYRIYWKTEFNSKVFLFLVLIGFSQSDLKLRFRTCSSYGGYLEPIVKNVPESRSQPQLSRMCEKVYIWTYIKYWNKEIKKVSPQLLWSKESSFLKSKS